MEQEQSIDTDKLSYEIFSILESKFLFGLDDRNLWPDLSAAAPPSDGSVTAVKNQRGKICVLSIDAGGMRSILPGKALSYLETAIRKKSGDQTANIADYFDLAAGAGVGGIFIAMLFGTKDHSRPIFQADDTWQFLATHGKKFYLNKKASRFSCTGSGTKTGSVSLERALRKAFSDEKGRCLTLKDTLKPVLIPCYDLATSAPFVFSRADALEADGFDFRLCEACCASSAAPAAALEPVEVASADGRTRCVAVGGGLGVSNPAAVAVTHVLHNKQEFPFVRGVEDILVLSLGTGQALDVSYGYEQVKRWKAKDWTRPVARISGDGSADFVDHAVAMAFGQSRSSNYVRIQANGSSLGHCGPNVDFDPSSSNVKMLMGIADEMLKQKNVESVLFGGKRIAEESNYEKLDWFAGELVLEHQRRSCRIAPTVAFKQATPKPI